MNYYEHHIGDFDSATAHLSLLEDAVYRRLICIYYRSESPLPSEIKQVCRLVRAISKQEKETVSDVLNEFFELQDDGWHNTRCDEEISRFQDKQAKAKRSADARWNKVKTQCDGNANAYADGMRSHSEGNAPRARPQSPDTNHQNILTNTVDNLTVPSVMPANPHQPAPDFENLPANVHPLTVKFKMHSEWEPGESFETLARVAGLVFGDKLPAKELGEFKTYWLTHPHQAIDQNQWEHKFIQNLLYQKARASK